MLRNPRDVLTVSDPDSALKRNGNGSVVITDVNGVVGILCLMGRVKMKLQWCRRHGNRK